MAINCFIPTVWSETLLRSIHKKYVGIANCNREYEGDILEKGSKVRILGLNDVTVADYVKNTNISAPQTLSDLEMELKIDQAKYFNFLIDDVDRAQSVPGLMELALQNVADALATTAEKYVYQAGEGAFNQIYREQVTTDNIVEILIDARTTLLKEGVTDPNDIVIEVTPDIAGMLLKAKMAISTDNSNQLENGLLGNIGGCKIYVSPNLPVTSNHAGKSHRCYARTRRAIAFAEQLSEVEAYRPEQRFADAMKGLHLYGAKMIYPYEIIRMELVIPSETNGGDVA